MLLYTIASVPLAIYLLLIGSLHLRKRPLVTSGWRDIMTMGIACLGLASVGPMQLFFPMHAAAVVPMLSWGLMFALYFMGLTLVMLWSKPRLTVYGMTATQFRDSLHQAALVVDSQSSWNGHVLTLPRAGFQLVAEPSTALRVHSVAAVETMHNNYSAWRLLERELVKAGHQLDSRPAKSAWILVGIATVLLVVAIAPVVVHPETTLAELKSFLWR